jgi:dTDP-4-dehydrorhamnose reductase
MSVPLPLLITGVSGVAGYSAFYHFRRLSPGQVVGTRPTATWKLNAEGLVPLDLEDGPGLTALFRQHRFRSVLNATGNCALKACEVDDTLAHRTNVESACNVANLVAEYGARLVHLSSDLVFSGVGAGNYSEDAPTDPVTVYGKTMAQGEDEIFRLAPSAAVLRISLPMGPSFNKHAGAIDWIDSRFRNSRPATLYFDEVRCPTYCDDLNTVFAAMLSGGASGLYHCGGPRPMSLYQIAQVINKAGGYCPSLLRGIPRREAGPVPPRAGNVSMDSGKLYRLLGGCPFQPWPLCPDLTPGPLAWHAERPPDWAGGRVMIRRRLYAHAHTEKPDEREAYVI